MNAYWTRRKNELPKNKTFEEAFVKTIKTLSSQNKEIYIVDDVPDFSFDPKQCKYLRPLSQKNNCTEDKNYFYKKYNAYYENLNKLRNLKHVKIVNTVKFFCDEQNCSMKNNGELLYRDSNHLNINGSKYLANKVIKEYPELSR